MRLLILFCILGSSCLRAQQTTPQEQTAPKTPSDNSTKHPGKPKSKANPAPLPFPFGPSTATTEQYERARKNAEQLSTEPAGVKGATGGEPETILRNRRRYALVIANQEYDELEKLHSPRVDAEALVDILASDGFIVQVFFDLDHEAFQNTLVRFEKTLRPDDFVFFYYSGHAMESDGYNVLLPVDFKKSDTAISRSRGITLDSIRELFGRGNRPRLLVLDSCRTGPLTTTITPPLDSKLAPPTENEAFVFSTSENNNAFDGSGWSRSTFSRTLTYALGQKEVGLKQAVRLAQIMVLNFSNARQRPQVDVGHLSENVSLWPEGAETEFAHTKLRDYVGLDFARDVNIVSRTKDADEEGATIGEAEHLLTLTGEWITAQHTPINGWAKDRIEKGVVFLEERLGRSELSAQDGRVWQGLKDALGRENTFWLCESLVFRKADLPAAIERIPPAIAKETEKNKPKEDRSFASVRAILGLLDAETLERLDYDRFKRQLPSAFVFFDYEFFKDASILPDAPVTGTMVPTDQVCETSSLNVAACNAKFRSMYGRLAKGDSNEIRSLAFLLEISMENRIPVDWWLMGNRDSTADWVTRIVSGLRRASVARLTQDPELQSCVDMFDGCKLLAETDDPLDPITSFTMSATYPHYMDAEINSWYHDKTDFETDASMEFFVGFTSARNRETPWGQRNQREAWGIPYWRSAHLISAAAIDCRESIAWRALNEESPATRSKVQASFYFQVESRLAQGLFDLTAMRHYAKEFEAVQEKDQSLSCWIEILEKTASPACEKMALPALSTETNKLVWPGSNQRFEDFWIRIFGFELAGDGKAADADIELARQWSNVLDSERISQKADDKAKRSVNLSNAERILALMRGKTAPHIGNDPLATLIPDLRISTSCQMPPEIH